MSHENETLNGPIDGLGAVDLRQLLAANRKKYQSELSEHAPTPSQEQIWYSASLQPESPVFNNAAIYRIVGSLDSSSLQASLREVIRRHVPLRSTFHFDGEGMLVVRLRANVDFSLSQSDLSRVPATSIDQETNRLALVFGRRTFALDRAPLIRGLLIRQQSNLHFLVIVVHHIVADGWSLAVLQNELVASYEAAVTTGQHRLIERPLPQWNYCDHVQSCALYEKSKAYQVAMEYWLSRLHDAPNRLAFAAKQSQQILDHAEGSVVHFSFSNDTTHDVRRLARELNTTQFVVMHSLLTCFIAAWTGVDDICIGMPTSGREDALSEPLIGLFINVVVVRMRLQPASTLREIILASRSAIAGALEHGRVPFERIVHRLGVQREAGHTPLYQILLIADNTEHKSFKMGALQIERQELHLGAVSTDLTFVLRMEGAEIAGKIEYPTDMCSPQYMQEKCSAWTSFVKSAIQSLDTPIREIPSNAQGQPSHLSSAVPAVAESLYAQIARWGIETPTAPAIIDSTGVHRYGSLLLRAEGAAIRLQQHGVKPGDRVAIVGRGDWAVTAALLGILRCGAVYVPIGSRTPKGRIDKILADSGARVVLCGDVDPSRIPEGVTQLLIADLPNATSIDLPLRTNDPDLCVLFTSGTTGSPKGVILPEKSVMSRIKWKCESFPLTSADRVLQSTPFVFDVSLWETFWALSMGSCLVACPAEWNTDPATIADWIEKHDVTAIHFVPSAMELLLRERGDRSFPKVRLLFSNGERLESKQVRRIHQTFGGELYNNYGPAEAAIAVTAHHCNRDLNSETIPIGRPIGDARVYLLDEGRDPVAKGASGEIYIGGPSLARGYANQSELTLTRFTDDPFESTEGSRMYRTGDIAIQDDQGRLEFLGRRDRQVKLNGHRIELEGIESALRSHPSIAECAVRLEDHPDGRRLVAAISPHNPELNDAEIRSWLLQTLPDFMVPSIFERHKGLARTESGKVDVKNTNRIPDGTVTVNPFHKMFGARSPKQYDIGGWFYEPVWRKAAGRTPTSSSTQMVVVVSGEAEDTAFLLQHLKHMAPRAVVITHGTSFEQIDSRRYIVRPDTDNDYRRVFERIEAPDCVVFCAELRASRSFGSLSEQLDSTDNAIRNGYCALVFLASAIPQKTTELLVVSNGMHSLSGDTECNPVSATMLGAVRCIPHEFPNIKCRSLDLPLLREAPSEAFVQSIVDEIGQTQQVIAFRHGLRWEPHYQPIYTPCAFDNSLAFQRNGSYIIVGGLGGIGMEIAMRLSIAHQARIALITRREFPAPDRWRELLACPDADPAVVSRIYKLRMMQAHGSNVVVIPADVTDPKSVSSALDSILRIFGRIDGVLQAAAVAPAALLRLRSAEQALEVMRPKVHGTIILEHFLDRIAGVRFHVLFSSLITEAGGVGVADYCSANCFLNAYATSRVAGLRSVASLRWGMWNQVGMASDWKVPPDLWETMQFALDRGITPEEGFCALSRAIASQRRDLVVSPTDIAAGVEPFLCRAIEYGDEHHRERGESGANRSGPDSDVQPVSPPTHDDKLLNEILEIWSEVLNRVETNPDANFFDSGGHSLMLMSLANRVSKRYGRLIPLAKLLQNPTPRACARFFVQNT